MKAFIILFALLVSLLQPLTADEQSLQRFYGEIWSPYCRGNSLLECPSGQAEDLRQKIRQQYEAGRPLDEIKASLEQTYGGKLTMKPEEGFRGSLAYSIPWIAFILVALVLIVYWMKRVRRSVADPNPPQVTSHAALSPELERDLKERLR